MEPLHPSNDSTDPDTGVYRVVLKDELCKTARMIAGMAGRLFVCCGDECLAVDIDPVPLPPRSAAAIPAVGDS